MSRLLAVFALSLLLGTLAHAAETITGRVSLDPALAGQASADDTVFIFARAVDGPRMPLAAIRARVADLPLAFRLDDSQAMSPAARLSGFDQVTVVARVSSGGGVQAVSGDLEGTSGVVTPGTQGIELVIDQIIR